MTKSSEGTMTTKEKVLKVYPDAKVAGNANVRIVSLSAMKILSGWYGSNEEEAAWQNAAKSLPAQPEPDPKCQCTHLYPEHWPARSGNAGGCFRCHCSGFFVAQPVAPVEAKEKESVCYCEDRPLTSCKVCFPDSSEVDKPTKEREQELEDLLSSMVRDFTEFLKHNAKSEVRRRIVEYAQLYASQPSDQPTQKEAQPDSFSSSTEQNRDEFLNFIRGLDLYDAMGRNESGATLQAALQIAFAAWNAALSRKENP